MARLQDKTISHRKSSKIKILELSLVFMLSRRNATNGEKNFEVFITKTKRFGSIRAVNKRNF